MKEYEYVVNDIKTKIELGQMNVGDKLPSIAEMTKLYNVSNITIRKGLSILIEDGYVETFERSGTYVKKSDNDSFLMNFHEVKNVNEAILKTEVLGITSVYDYKLQGESVGVSTVKLRRVFYTYLNVPVLYDIKHMFHHRSSNVKILNKIENIKRLDDLFEKDTEKTLELEIVYPNKEIQDLFEVGENEPIYYVKQRYYDKYGQLVMVGESYALTRSMDIRAVTSNMR